MQDYLCDIKRIVVSDTDSEGGESLELRVANRNFARVESNNENYYEIHNKELHFYTSGGILYIPRGIPVCITSENPIFGLTSSIGHISTLKTIDLCVRHNSPHNIMLHSEQGFYYINNKLVKFKEFKDYEKIIDYDELFDEYDSLFTAGLQMPSVFSNMDFSKADFSRSAREEIYDYELCEFGNALYLECADTLNIHDVGIRLKKKKMEKKEIQKPSNTERLLRDFFLDSLMKRNISNAERAFRNWKYYLIYKDNIKEELSENKKIKKIVGEFNADYFYKNPKNL